MKLNAYYSLNKGERALQILCYYKAKAIVVPYINLKYTAWNGEKIRIECSAMVILMSPPADFDVKDFLESIREHWLFEIRDGRGLEVDVYIEERNLEDENEDEQKKK